MERNRRHFILSLPENAEMPYASELEWKVSIFKKEKKKIQGFLLRGPKNVWLISFSSLKLVSCWVFLLNNCKKKKWARERLFHQSQKIVRNKSTKGIEIGSCIFLYFHDCLHFFLNLLRVERSEKKISPEEKA